MEGSLQDKAWIGARQCSAKDEFDGSSILGDDDVVDSGDYSSRAIELPHRQFRT